jgi:hypothetical protein
MAAWQAVLVRSVRDAAWSAAAQHQPPLLLLWEQQLQYFFVAGRCHMHLKDADRQCIC